MVVYCHTDPYAKSVQYLDLLNTLIFPKIFSTGDILTLVDHTLIDHTACTVFLVYDNACNGHGNSHRNDHEISRNLLLFGMFSTD